MKNIPEKIYLQIDDDEVEEDFTELEVTWCVDRINQNDIAYIREPSTEQSGGTKQEDRKEIEREAYNAGLMCERILAKDKIERLTEALEKIRTHTRENTIFQIANKALRTEK